MSMKSAEVWASKASHTAPLMCHVDLILRIQIDAMKHGMEVAAKMAGKQFEDANWNGLYRNAGDSIYCKILTKANNLTLDDL